MTETDTVERRENWRKRWAVAHVWYCGDEVCDCTQPLIELIEPNYDAGYPWVRRSRLWEGTFRSDGEGSSEEWRVELEPAAARYGITLDEHLSGRALHSQASDEGAPSE